MLDRLRRNPFPGVTARMGLSDSLVFVGIGSGSPRQPPTDRWLLCRPRDVRNHRPITVGGWSPAPRIAGVSVGKTRVSQVTGPSSYARAVIEHLASCSAPSP